jgi:hypothetical protein
MKKWLIFAVIAAMFAMVMFPACGNKGDDRGSAADNVEVRQMLSAKMNEGKYGSGAELIGYNITWEGVPGYDYYVYYEVKDPDGTITPAASSKAIKGQTLFKFDQLLNSATPPAPTTPFIKVSDADDANSWSILVTDNSKSFGQGYSGTVDGTDHGGTATDDLWTDWTNNVWTVTGSMVRVAVLPAFPGGFPMEEKTVKYSNWFDGNANPGETPTPGVITTP